MPLPGTTGPDPVQQDVPAALPAALAAIAADTLAATAATLHGQGIGPTPAYDWPLLAQRLGAPVWVKHENHLPTGAFKVRGGMVHLAELTGAGHLAGLVSATRGNHGQSLAFAGARFGVPVTIVVPRGNSAEKNAAMRALGARLVEYGDDFDQARTHAAALATDEGLRFAPSFHPDLVRGVATYAWELLTQVPDLEVLYVPIGLGSGICGCIAARGALGSSCRIVGVQSSHAPSYALSMAAGHVVTTESALTRADGMATRVPDAVALATILAGADRIVTVSDDQVADAVRALWTDTHNLAEGAGAAALAAALADKDRPADAVTGVVLTGGNIDLALFRDWIT